MWINRPYWHIACFGQIIPSWHVFCSLQTTAKGIRTSGEGLYWLYLQPSFADLGLPLIPVINEFFCRELLNVTFRVCHIQLFVLYFDFFCHTFYNFSAASLNTKFTKNCTLCSHSEKSLDRKKWWEGMFWRWWSIGIFHFTMISIISNLT